MKEIDGKAVLQYALDCLLMAAKQQGYDLSDLLSKARAVAMDSGDKSGAGITKSACKTEVVKRITEAVDRVQSV
ncbi:hypothetical protein [Orrella dioscoreae]|uniref:Uncharacterized protein n=1 Tax=Orrella dioscoreae TaxID=1851544 RepID=A0A1C3K7T2_9BURK|nr:hypothetical protein [Orrella dioscoreae]SBT27570.1 hypothetical protein ODI_02472 [Orrella dioscoreae]SOE48059.1 hypothetical protein ODI_R1208 [Orrella dioscoreae]